MRIAVAFLVLVGSTMAVQAEPGARAMTVADSLGLDPETATKVMNVVVRYDTELARLDRQRIELKRRLVLSRRDPRDVELVLDDVIANQRALAQNEEQLVRSARKLLGPHRAAALLVLINATEPAAVDESPPPAVATTPVPPARSSYDPNALFPPRPRCDPFESMHGCGR